MTGMQMIVLLPQRTDNSINNNNIRKLAYQSTVDLD